MNLAFGMIAAAAAIFGFAFILNLVSFFGFRESGARVAFTLMRVGFLLTTSFFVVEAVGRGFFLPIVNFAHVMAFFAWSIAFVYLVLLTRVQTDSYGLILNPILFLFLVCSSNSLSSLDAESIERYRSLAQNPYFVLHIVSAFFAYAAFTVSFASGVFYLLQHRQLKKKQAGRFYHQLPSLEELEQLIFKPLVWGAPMLCLAIGIGFLWSRSEYGGLWLEDPKTIMTLVSAAFYIIILFLKYRSLLRGRQVAALSIIAFALVFMSFVGLRFVEGSHSFHS